MSFVTLEILIEVNKKAFQSLKGCQRKWWKITIKNSLTLRIFALFGKFSLWRSLLTMNCIWYHYNWGDLYTLFRTFEPNWRHSLSETGRFLRQFPFSHKHNSICFALLCIAFSFDFDGDTFCIKGIDSQQLHWHWQIGILSGLTSIRYRRR